MAQPATNPKIEELRFRVKTDPKSRLFYQLAEELRKAGLHGESEQALRSGLAHHPTYLSAWVSLGRVLRDQQKHREAVEALNKALQVDPGNVVAARLLADSYYALGEKIEAIKKYKLAYAQVPGDEELEAVIARVDQEINQPGAPSPAPAPWAEPQAPTPAAAVTPPAAVAPPPPPAPTPAPAPPPPQTTALMSPTSDAGSSNEFFDITYSRLKQGIQVGETPAEQEARKVLEGERKSAIETGDAEPMSAAHADSPFEDPGVDDGYGADAFAVEQPPGVHLTPAPLAADLPSPTSAEGFGSDSPWSESNDDDGIYRGSGDVAPGFVTEPFNSNIAPPPPDPDDFARTITMADLYANQGLIDEARDIYEDVLLRDPSNESVRAKLLALESAPAAAQPAFEETPEEDFTPDDESVMTDPFAPAGELDLSSEPLLPLEAAPPSVPQRNPKIEKLEHWLAKVRGGEGGRV